MIFDDHACELGEGALWHPLRKELFWFDIIGKRLFARGLDAGQSQSWNFTEHVSAAGWVDQDHLLIASETSLFRFDLTTAARQEIIALEADKPDTRSNDGRADPYGGFWIGTMGKKGQQGAGAIYRFYRGELRKLYSNITIPNAICFSPSGDAAYFTDTPTRQIMKTALDDAGWPKGEARTFIDLRAEAHNPDGAVVDASGCLWNAQWGAHRVACYDPHGQFLREIRFPASQISCPAFGGPAGQHLFATSAREDIKEPSEQDGMSFVTQTDFQGQQEHQVMLPVAEAPT